MKLNSHLLLPAIAVASLTICSCNREKPYTINGVLNIPAEIPYGDTLLQLPSPEGEWVYLMEDGEDPVDSCQIVDNRFTFSGVVSKDDAHFAQVGCMFFSALVAIEPGDITISADVMQSTVSGTPSNDALNSMMFEMSAIEETMQQVITAMQDSLDKAGVEMGFEQYEELQNRYITMQGNALDSIYEANKDNLASIYAAVLRNADNGSASEFEEAMNQYPKRVSENAFVKQIIRSLKQQEEMMQGQSYDENLFGDAETQE